jgi:hypothetical protein
MGGSDLNIIYAEMLNAMGVDRACVWPTGTPFHGIVLGNRPNPSGQIDLPITFGDKSNFRTETLTLEVVSFHGTYHAILGRPCYEKFMAIPIYTYLKMKMLRPHGVITVSTSFQHAYECDVECCELAMTTVTSEELAVIREVEATGTLNSKRRAGAFEPTEGTKEVPVDPNDPNGKALRVGTDLSPK